MNYRSDIDGLRAIAVLAVIFSHANIAHFGGGFIGVDVFFVLSGYLITSIILEDYRRGDFSLPRFYQRRVKRILPALFFVLACSAAVAWFLLLPGAYEAFSKSLMLSALSVSNFYFLKKTDYFAADAAEVPLLHTWSLGVEEQFYLLFPLLFLFGLKTRTIFITVAVLAVASLIASEIGSWWFPSANYYLLPTRAWEILAGSLCAFYLMDRERRPNGILAALGLIFIVCAIVLFEPSTRIPSFAALLPVGGSVLLILFSHHTGIVGRILSVAPIVWIGRVSFSAYLWHQPVFAFARIRSLEPPTQVMMSGLIVLVLLLAAVSWRFVEQPFRHARASGRRIAMSVAFSLVLAVGFGSWGAQEGLPFRVDPKVASFMNSAVWSGACLFQSKDGLPLLPAEKCMFNTGAAQKTYAIWGDSISAAISPALLEELKERNVGLIQLTHGHCAPIADVWTSRNDQAVNCSEFNRRALDYLLASKVEVVVLAASWVNFFNASHMSVDGVELGGAEITVPVLANRLKRTVEKLEQAGKRVVLVYPTPRFNKSVTEVMAAMMIKGDSTPDFAYPVARFREDTARAYAILNGGADHKIEKVLPETIFCGPAGSDQCYLGRDSVPFIADKSHYTQKGAELVVDGIMDELENEPDAEKAAALRP
ncbi:acyltransferase family protein [Agrobacterium sp. CG674]